MTPSTRADARCLPRCAQIDSVWKKCVTVMYRSILIFSGNEQMKPQQMKPFSNSGIINKTWKFTRTGYAICSWNREKPIAVVRVWRTRHRSRTHARAAEILGDNKVAEVFAEIFETNLAIFLLIFIKLSLFSLFFLHASTCSPLLTCNTRREGRANVHFAPPHDSNFTVSPGFPRELGRACTLARPSLRVLQVSGEE